MTATDASVGSLLRDGEVRLEGSGIAAPRLEAEVLLARALETSRGGLIARTADHVGDEAREAYLRDIARRCLRYPLQYITGTQEFYSLDLDVDPRVLIPRPETEMIVDEVLRRVREEQGARGASAPLVMADIGTGSGCIAIALAHHLPRAQIWATDISAGALEVAARNASKHGVSDRIHFLQGPGLAPLGALPRPGLQALVSNPPYIARSELAGLQPELSYEPATALSPGPEGLEVVREIVAGASDLVVPGGWLMIELAAGRDRDTERLVDRSVWQLEPTRLDMQGIPRLLLARRAA